jgi:protein farnesyltransferase/geranylgeranyltransferase type-1 subunit alpha
MDYFRAAAQANEMSKRVLDLTAHIIDMNPAHYTIWYVISTDLPSLEYGSSFSSSSFIFHRQYRQRLLDALKIDLSSELDFVDELAEEKSKNYQIW